MGQVTQNEEESIGGHNDPSHGALSLASDGSGLGSLPPVVDSSACRLGGGDPRKQHEGAWRSEVGKGQANTDEHI